MSTPVTDIDKLVQHYKKICKVPCKILDMREKTGSMPHCPMASNPCCGCRDYLLSNALLSERFGGSYVFFCHGAFIFWASPIVMDAKVTHIVLVGPVRVISSEEIAEELAKWQPMPGKKLLGKIRHVTSVDTDTVHSMSEILRMCASWASGFQEYLMTDSQHMFGEQSDLFSAIERLKQQKQMPLYSLEDELNLKEGIIHHDSKQAQASLETLLGIIFCSCRNNSQELRDRLQETITLMARAALTGNADEDSVWELTERSYRSLFLSIDSTHVFGRMCTLLRHFLALVPEHGLQYHKSTKDAIAYGCRHYMKRITLQDVAGEANMCVSLFCRTFMNDTGKTWVAWLTQFRIEKAKSLLRTTNSSLMVIAEATGFPDQCYFSRVFRKEEGLSPSVYKKNLSRYPSDTKEIH